MAKRSSADHEDSAGSPGTTSERMLVVVAAPDLGLRATAEGAALSNVGEDVSSLTNVLSSVGAKMKPLFETSEDRLQAEASFLADTTGVNVPDLSVYYKVDAPEDQLDRIAEELSQQPSIAAAYVKPPTEAPVLMDDVAASTEEPPINTPDFTSRQLYLNAAPVGIDARYAWTQPGGRGANVRIVDIEGAWRFTHEDLKRNQGGLAGGTMSTNLGWRNHGTAVIGEFSGDRNSFGVQGIASDANVRAVSIFGGLGSAAAIRRAADILRAGDVILLELHRPGPRFNFQSRGDQRGYIAIEWWPDDYDAIRYATAKGIVVVEAAGNGAEDLDDAIYQTRPTGFPASWTNPFNRNNRDSRAIVVGAGAPPPGTHGRNHGADRSRLGFSNYGRLIDAQGWGREVTTVGYGDLQGGSNEDEWYTDKFSGTSSASPHIVGAVACVQGVRRARGEGVLSPLAMRNKLRSTGSPQQDTPGRPSSQRIGKRPNLRQLIRPKIVVNPCTRYRTAAKRYALRYRRTKNRQYLCLSYRYYTLYYRCLYKRTKKRKYLCLYYRYVALYARCRYQVTKNRSYLCRYYRYMGLYNNCQYTVTKVKRYRCLYYRYTALYYRCLYQTTGKRIYLSRYKLYLKRYNACR